MLKRLKELGRGTKMFLLASIVPPIGLFIEQTCGGGLCSACPLSGGCAAAVTLSIGAVLGFKIVRQAIRDKSRAYSQGNDQTPTASQPCQQLS